jgi:transcriptional regulator NrdR family protein
MKCPVCDKETDVKSIRDWEFREYTVSRNECQTCHKIFNVYKKEGKIAYTIPRTK